MQHILTRAKSLRAYLAQMRPGDEVYISAENYTHAYVRVAAADAAKDNGHRIKVHNNGSGCEVRCFAR